MINGLFTLSQHFLDSKNQDYRRYFIRETDLSHRMNIVVGARGIGKTTTLIQHLLDYVQGDLYSRKILYLQADHFLVAESSLYEIAEQFVLNGGEYIAFDEIHKYPQWSMELKSIYDTFDELKIIASGSSALEIHKGSHDLSRRALLFSMQGLAFREFLELYHHIQLPHFTLSEILSNHEKITKEVLILLNQKKIKILPELENYYQQGYYPYARDMLKTEHYYMTLEQNIHVTLESDLVAIYPHLTGNSIRKVKQLLSFIAGSVPFIPSWNKIKTIVEIGDIRTLKNYFKYLQDAGLILSVSKGGKKMDKIEAQEKIFLSNTNLLYTLSADTPNMGTIRETFFISMLVKDHDLAFPKNGDFLIDNKYTFEVGGRNKDFSQIKDNPSGYIAADNLERSSGRKIPLWLFGFLY